ncbi:MAG: DUF2491 family protein [Halomonas sp.]|nr:DUF2491 family protein [Halomonas sp.]MDP3536321.1 DUF2491 family protein [Halomonas sp.]
MIGALKTLFRSNSKNVQDEHAKALMERSKGLPLGVTPDDMGGLRLGGMASLNFLAVRDDERFLFDSTWHNEDQRIEAIGVVELGDGEQLVRCYLENDTWIQASLRHGKAFEYKVFDFWKAEHIANTEFERLVNHSEDASNPSQLGAKTFRAESDTPTTYDRVWGAAESEWTPPVILEETVTRLNSDETAQVFHHCMLFERAIPETERFEYILLSAEADDADGSYQLVTNLGIDLRELSITAQ